MPATPTVHRLPGLDALSPSARDRLAYELRERGWRWADIAAHLGMGHESTARTSAGRHRATLGDDARPFGYVPRGRRHIVAQATWDGQWSGPSVPAPSAFTFGVEIEVESIGQTAAARALEPVLGYLPMVGHYHSNRSDGYRRWVIENDGSLGYGGAEVVSPILTGEAGITQVVAVVDALQAAGASVSQRCGLHVHIHRGPLTADQLSNVIDFYTLCQPAISSLLLRSRRHCGYARPVDNGHATAGKAYVRHQARYCPERYLAYNLAHVHRVGTIEWRQHHGSLRSAEVSSWVRFLLGIYEAARVGAPLPTDVVTDVETMVRLLPIRRATARALIARPSRRRFS